jgi:uncharacterized protein YycO
MKYQSGDILMVHNYGLLERAIRIITRSPYNHCGLFISENEIIEATYKGVIISPLSKFSNSTVKYFDVYRVKGIDKVDITPVLDFAKKQVGAKYDKFQFMRMLLMYMFRISRKKRMPDEEGQWICSELVAESFEQAYILFSSKIKPDNIVPGDIPKSDTVYELT